MGDNVAMEKETPWGPSWSSTQDPYNTTNRPRETVVPIKPNTASNSSSGSIIDIKIDLGLKLP